MKRYFQMNCPYPNCCKHNSEAGCIRDTKECPQLLARNVIHKLEQKKLEIDDDYKFPEN